jgi:hypothetical protein
MFASQYKTDRQTDTYIHKELDLHRPITNLSAYQKEAHYAGIKMNNKLPLKLNAYP